MLKIRIKTFSGIIEEGWIRSDSEFIYYDKDAKVIKWLLEEGDLIEILEDIDGVDVPQIIKDAVHNPQI